MKCMTCNKEVELRIGWRAVTLRCTGCGKDYSIKDYADEMNEEMWETISRRPVNRAWKGVHRRDAETLR